KLFVFVDGSFANNKDLSSQIGYEIIIANEKTRDHSFEITGNLIHYSSTKSKRVTRSVLASEVYGMLYEKRELTEIRWINGNDNPADAMTKTNPNKALQKFVDTNTLEIRVDGWILFIRGNGIYYDLKIEVASVDGNYSVSDLQALHSGALGERGQMALRRKGLCVDDNAHTITAMYNDGALQFFSIHAGRFQNKDDQSSYVRVNQSRPRKVMMVCLTVPFIKHTSVENFSIEKLSMANHEKWFRLMKAKIRSKNVMHVLDMTLEDYAKVLTPDFQEAELSKELEEVTSSI
ncbi:hypothetical protein EPUL_005296, partial [Erysiphe pulchra]